MTRSVVGWGVRLAGRHAPVREDCGGLRRLRSAGRGPWAWASILAVCLSPSSGSAAGFASPRGLTATQCRVWARIGSPTPTFLHDMIYDTQRGVFVLYGGYCECPVRGLTWEWDGAAWRVASMEGPGHRTHVQMVYDEHRGVTVLFGGISNGPKGDTWEWDGHEWKLAATTGPAPRSGHAMAYDASRGVVLLYGGHLGGDGESGHNDETWEWDGHSWRRIKTNSAGRRSGHEMAYDAKRNVMVLIGGVRSHDPFRGTWEWDGRNWMQRSNGDHDPLATDIAYDERSGGVIVYGRNRNRNRYSRKLSRWVWDGAQWSLTSTPPLRRGEGAAIAFDPTSGTTLMHGGTPGGRGPDSETWALNETGWALLDTTPLLDGNAAFSYDAMRRKAVFLGDVRFDSRPQTWEWDGKRWRLASRQCPSAREIAAMAYDADREETILFGGRDRQSRENLGDTWAWDGRRWTALTTEGPSPRHGHAMTYDAAHRQVLLMGGTTDRRMDDTWLWDGVQWSIVNAPGPGKRTGHALSYDPQKEVALLYGGIHGPDRGVWEWNGAGWRGIGARPAPGRERPLMVFAESVNKTFLFNGEDRAETWLWDGGAWERASRRVPDFRFPFAPAFTMFYDEGRRAPVVYVTTDAGISTEEMWEWQIDCNCNGYPDALDIRSRRSGDADGNGVPDECEG